MKKIRCLLLGAHINSSNLGCQALTYSLIAMLEKISKEKGFLIDYSIFEYQPNVKKTNEFKKKMGLSNDRLVSYMFPYGLSIKEKIRNIKSYYVFYNQLSKSDVAIDITAGDSFSDIYGDERFLITTRIKELVEKKGVPLILAPQTYGPFNKSKNEQYAAKIIKGAFGVITRDIFSAQYVKSITDLDIPITTDLAFQLPFTKKTHSTNKLNIGINISGLLVSDAAERGFVNNGLDTDYDEYIDRVIQFLISEKKYNIFLISHVEEDFKACKYYAEKYPSTELVQVFDNPIDIKSFISGMDIFIGARMHATIASFTSGVVTIPTAYSRKFETMFSVVNYDVIIDLQVLNTNEAFEKTILYINHYKELNLVVKESLKFAKKYSETTEEFFINKIMSI